jgi:hypothetical protein
LFIFSSLDFYFLVSLSFYLFSPSFFFLFPYLFLFSFSIFPRSHGQSGALREACERHHLATQPRHHPVWPDCERKVRETEPVEIARRHAS